jgi:5-methylcytosine-specific restriction endonuclease McrA
MIPMSDQQVAARALTLLTAFVRAPHIDWMADRERRQALLVLSPREDCEIHDRLEAEVRRLIGRPGLVDRLSRARGLDDLDRLSVFARDAGLCRYCGAATTLETFHADHVIPRAQGGSDSPANLVCACPSCNLSKGDRTPEQWRGLSRPEPAHE